MQVTAGCLCSVCFLLRAFKEDTRLNKIDISAAVACECFLIVNQQAHSAVLEQHTPHLHVMALELDLYPVMYSMEPHKNLFRISFVLPRNIFCVFSL